MSEVIIYTKVDCPYCRAAMEQYRSEGIPFKEVDVNSDAGAKKLIREQFSADKVPVIVRDGKLVGIGFNGGG